MLCYKPLLMSKSNASLVHVKQTINALGRILNVPEPRWQRKPDPANMPLLAHQPFFGMVCFARPKRSSKVDFGDLSRKSNKNLWSPPAIYLARRKPI
jgi:hypothetical protein